MREEDHATVEREVCELAALRHPTFCVAVEAGRRESDVIAFAFLECSKPVLLSSTAWGEGEGGAVLVGSSLCSFGYDVWHPARRPLLSLSLSLPLSPHHTLLLPSYTLVHAPSHSLLSFLSFTLRATCCGLPHNVSGGEDVPLHVTIFVHDQGTTFPPLSSRCARWFES